VESSPRRGTLGQCAPQPCSSPVFAVLLGSCGSDSSGIADDQYMTLSTLGSGEDTFTADEALEACEAVRLGLQNRQPELQVEVLRGETVVATGSAGVACPLA
jgi:hypothetical protein